jgi:hypothetical protein
MNTPELSIITLALATQSAFAPHREASGGTATVAMPLLTDYVEIADTLGRRIKATAASYHLRRLAVIRKQSGWTANRWNGLGSDTVKAITGKAPLPVAVASAHAQGIADNPIEAIRRITFPCRPKHNLPLHQQIP